MAVIIQLPALNLPGCLSEFPKGRNFEPALSFAINRSKLLSSRFFTNKTTANVPYKKLYPSVKAWFLLRVHPYSGIDYGGNHFYIGTDCNSTAIDLGQFTSSPYYNVKYTDFGTCPRYCGWDYEYNTVSLNHLIHAFASSTLEELLNKLTVHYFPSNLASGDTCGAFYANNFYTIFTPNGNIKAYATAMASQLGLLNA